MRATLAIIGMVVSEMIYPSGLGRIMQEAMAGYRTSIIFAGLVSLSIGAFIWSSIVSKVGTLGRSGAAQVSRNSRRSSCFCHGLQAQFAGPVVAAKPKGAYERERLLVEIEPGGFVVNTPMEVAQGNAEFGIVQPDQLIRAQTQLTGSNRLRAIATIFKDSMTCFMVRTTSGIKTVSDFRGKRVGTKENTNVDVEFHAMLQRAGVEPSDVELIPVQYDIGLFISGRIDVFQGFVINEPYIARTAGIETELLKPSQFGVSLYGDELVTSEKMLRNKKDIVQRFVNGTLQGWLEAKARPREAVREVLERSPLLDSDAQTFMAEAAIGLLNVGEQAFKSDPARWRENVGILEQFRGVEQGTVDPDGLFTNEFVEHSNVGVASE